MPSRMLDDDDRRHATRQAAESRAERAEIKRELKSGALDLATLLERAVTDRVVARMPVMEVLTALPAYGPRKSAKLMEAVGIASNRRLGGLGARQQEALMKQLKGRS